jgi:hypothetical protein
LKAQLIALAMTALLALPAASFAQGRMPHTDAGAVGADVGLFVPRQDGMSTGPEISGFYEHYLSPRDSVRAVVGWMNANREGVTDSHVRQVRIGADLIHNWEGGAVHPFLGVGLSAYVLQRREGGADVGENATKLGGTLIGGAEYFTSKTFSIKGEARYHVVSDWDGYNPSGLALTVGVKSYF